MKSGTRIVPLLMLAMGLSAAPAQAATALPLALQAALISKLMHYDRTLPENLASIKMLIIYHQATADADQLRDSLQKLGVHSECIPLDQLAARAGAAQVLYVMADVPVDSVRDFAERNHTLSLAGVTDWAERGQVAIAFSKGADDKPEIVVHLNRLGAEKHELASSLLGLARVIR